MKHSSNIYWKGFISLIVIALIGLGSQSLYAQSYENRQGDSINPRFYIKAGYYLPNLRTSLRIDGRRLGTEVSLENTLNLE